MKKTPLFSVLIPCWNRQTYLPECIRSIQAQTYKNIEIILVDDGSTDDSKFLYDYYTKTDPRIKVVYGEHKGIAAARNLAFKHAKGDYIAVFDSDDVMHETRLKENAKVLGKVDFCSSYYWISDKHLNIESAKVIVTNTNVEFQDIKDNASWAHFMISANRKCFEEHPYREEFKVNDDAGLVWDWFRAGYTYKVIKKPLGVQRGHSGNTSKKVDKIDEIQQILNKEYLEYENSLTS